MNSNNGDEVSFFKILLCDSVDYLPLPPAFAKKFFGKGNYNQKQTLVLKPKSGVKWSVKCIKIEDKYYFMDGWLKFMKDNHVQVGDFLVFWRLSASPKSTFQVFIYAPNGCLKHPISSTSGVSDGKKQFVKKGETIDDDANDASLVGVRNCNSSKRVFRKSHIHHLPMTTTFLKATGMDGNNSVRLRNEDGKTWEVKVSHYGRKKAPYLTRGWMDFWKGSKMRPGNTYEIFHVKGKVLHVRVIKKPRGRACKKNRSN